MGDVSREEHKEFMERMKVEHKRLDDENARQNKRLEILEQQLLGLSALTTSVEKLAVNVEVICKELTRQGNRLEELESRDGETWRNVKYYVLTALISAAIGFAGRGFS